MIAAKYDITIDRAALFKVSLTIYNDIGSVVNLTGGTFYSDIRDKETKKEVTQFSITPVTNGTDGKVYISLSEANTKILTDARLYEYDLFMILSGRTYRLLEGAVIVRNNITNNV